ncbi:MAG: caspase family protein [Clostridia bacterium]
MMSLKSYVDKLFKDNTDYANAMQAVNQADSIDALSKDLYTDADRFIYELLQNADDSSVGNNPIKVWINIIGDTLIVAHSGKVFDKSDIIGLCNINNGTKKSDITKTGYKGIGFKSVFGQSDEVVVYTDKEYFRFDKLYNFPWDEKWGENKIEWEKEHNRYFQLPWQIIPIYTDGSVIEDEIKTYLFECGANVATIIKLKYPKDVCGAISSLTKNINMFLFLKNICEINFVNVNTTTIYIKRKDNEVMLSNSHSLKDEWIIKKTKLEVTKDLKEVLKDERNIPPKLLEATNIEMTFAAKVNQEGIVDLSQDERLLYSYLPTSESKYSFPVLVNTNFLTNANRQSIHVDSKWNQWLFENISYEIFVWISELVKSEISFEAYKLIPKATIYNDDLGSSYNRGIEKAKKEIPFIVSRNNQLIKLNDSVIDFTFLSAQSFIGENPILQYIQIKYKNNENIQYAQYCLLSNELKKLGAISFEWKDLKEFLKSPPFINTHDIEKNKSLLNHLNSLCKKEKLKSVTNEFVSELTFILNHKGYLSTPASICFPTSEDENWNNPNSELLFIHKDILSWLLTNTEIKNWLQDLGVKEKTDITYIRQIIIPDIDNYITLNNAVIEIQKLFQLYRKGELREDLIHELSQIRLLTQNGTLLQASKCYLADYYNPRLKIETMLNDDIFVSELYCIDLSEKDRWKMFLKTLGASDGIHNVNYDEKTSKSSLIQKGFLEKYFLTSDKLFKPLTTTFRADEFSNVSNLALINYTLENFKFADAFWCDYIKNHNPSEIASGAKAYWGNSGMPGRNSGDVVINYLPWFIKNVKCVPTVMKKTESSDLVFLNTDEIKKIGGKYLPIFSGPELSQDWKAFFQFKTTLQVDDYLNILRQISIDVKDDKIKSKNYDRVQAIYSVLLDDCRNWSIDIGNKVKKWSESHKLLNTNDTFTESGTLKYYIDGNESIFQEQYVFIKLNSKNQNHPNLENLLSYFQIVILKQDQFKLQSDSIENCTSLKGKLNAIIPYFKIWVEYDDNDDSTKQHLLKLEESLKSLNILQSNKLEITYSEIGFSKEANVHFDNKELYVTTPWNSNFVLLKLSEMICRYLELIGHESKLDFLLRSNIKEIQQYFIQESIEFPQDWMIKNDKGNEDTQIIDSDDFHESPEPDFDKKNYIENLIPRSVANVIKHLTTLQEYDCSEASAITSKSVILGIKKNGNDIAVVARPSDNGKMRLFYESEFDVLEYADAELWYEDGISPPRQFTFGKLLKMVKINKIPLKKIEIKDTEFNNPKSETLEFNAVPYSPEKTAQIIASFANTLGGTLIWGIKERSKLENEVVGLSSDFRVDEIVKKAVTLLNTIPVVNYNWTIRGNELIFVIEVEKSENIILLNKQKFIRTNDRTISSINNSGFTRQLNSFVPQNTIAIIIAIEEYLPRNSVPTVKYAVNDANKIKDVLIKVMNVDEDNIHMILNEEAVKNTLEYDLKQLLSSLTENDRLFFYYAGHGFHNGVSNCLSTYDMHPSNISATSIELDQMLLNPLKSSKCKNALIFIDACAQSFRNDFARNNVSNISEDSLYIFAKDHPYYAIFMSCQTGESSYSSHDLQQGIWTHYLAQTISNPPKTILYNNRFLTDVKLKDYLAEKVTEYVKKELNKDQSPKAIIDSSYENVII